MALVTDLQAKHCDRHKKTIDGLTWGLEKARSLAMDSGNSAAGVLHIMVKAKLDGLLLDRA